MTVWLSDAGPCYSRADVPMKIKIEDVRIPNRIRRKTGNLAPLTESMDRFGLIHPILIDQKHRLVTGFRRLQAAKRLGWETIDARMVELESKRDRTLLEMDENLVRRDFSSADIDRAEKLLQRYEKESIFSRFLAVLLDFFDRIAHWFSKDRSR